MTRTLTLLPLLVGCATHGGIQTAHTVGKGNFQGAVEPGVAVVASGLGNGVLPNVSFAGRYGVSERVDIGGRLGYPVGYELNAKFQLTDSDGVIASVAPSTSSLFGTINGEGGGYWWTQAPLLIGIPAGEHQFIFGPNLMAAFGWGTGSLASTAISLLPGGQLAVSLKVSDGVRIHPEIAVKVPLYTSASAVNEGQPTGLIGAMLGFNFALLFGGN